jgi:hypothetical protein
LRRQRYSGKQIASELIEDDKGVAEAGKELDSMDRARTATEVGITNAGLASGGMGPVQFYKIFVDSTKTDEEIRKILDEIKKDILKYTPVTAPKVAVGADPKKPASRPEKQPTPEEVRVALAKQQAANQA